MTKPTYIAVAGANGRMGKELLHVCLEDSNIILTAALVRDDSPLIATNVTDQTGREQSNIQYTSQQQPVDSETNVMIDFTLPDNTLLNLQHCVEANLPLVIGTTGFTSEQQLLINKAAKKIPILQASNMSVGVNLTLALLRQAAKILADTAKIEIIETHHTHKKDSPSGTAITMAEVIANSMEKELNQCMVIDDTDTVQYEAGTIKIRSIREAEVVGDHQVNFMMDDEIIEISHKAISRQIFAKGAIRGAIWLADKETGFYSMEDVLAL